MLFFYSINMIKHDLVIKFTHKIINLKKYKKFDVHFQNNFYDLYYKFCLKKIKIKHFIIISNKKTNYFTLNKMYINYLSILTITILPLYGLVPLADNASVASWMLSNMSVYIKYLLVFTS